MSTQDYQDSLIYEYFICRAFNCPRGNRNGADASYMKNAMSLEAGETYAKHLGSFDKQFSKVKDYIQKALVKLLKTKSYKDSHPLFESKKEELHYAGTTTALMRVIRDAMNEMNKYRED